jgi:hypothetical protein
MKLIPYTVCVAIVAIIGTNVIQTAHATVDAYQERILEQCEQMNQILPNSCQE